MSLLDKLPTKTGSLNHDYRKTFDSEVGKRVLRDIMVYGHIFDVLPSDSREDIFFSEGQRNVAIYILNRLQEPRDPDRYREQQKQASIDSIQRRTQ